MSQLAESYRKDISANSKGQAQTVEGCEKYINGVHHSGSRDSLGLKMVTRILLEASKEGRLQLNQNDPLMQALSRAPSFYCKTQYAPEREPPNPHGISFFGARFVANANPAADVGQSVAVGPIKPKAPGS